MLLVDWVEEAGRGAGGGAALSEGDVAETCGFATGEGAFQEGLPVEVWGRGQNRDGEEAEEVREVER